MTLPTTSLDPDTTADVISTFVSTCSGAFIDVGRHFTCGEAESLSDVIRLVDPEAADLFIDMHAHGDYEETDEHHALYLKHQEGL